MLGASTDAGQTLRCAIHYSFPHRCKLGDQADQDQRTGRCRSRESPNRPHTFPRRYPRIIANRRNTQYTSPSITHQQKCRRRVCPPRRAHADAVEHEGTQKKKKRALQFNSPGREQGKNPEETEQSVLRVDDVDVNRSHSWRPSLAKVNTRRGRLVAPFVLVSIIIT